MDRRELLWTLGAVLAAGVICGTILVRHWLRTRTSADDGPGVSVAARKKPEGGVDTSTQRPSAWTPARVEKLEERLPHQTGGGYYVWLLIEPMTRAELRELGEKLVRKTRQVGGDHLKAWVHYSREDYAVRQHVLWLNAVSPGYELRISGPVPDDRTAEACYQAFVAEKKWMPLVALDHHPGNASEVGLACEYRQADSTLVFHDRGLQGRKPQHLSVPAVVIAVCEGYLPGMAPSPLASIPGLERVVIHLYGRSDEKVATVSFGRRAFDAAWRLQNDEWWKRRLATRDVETAALKRHRAMVLSDRELEAVEDQCAYQRYKLLEEVWVEIAPLLTIEIHKPLPKEFPLGLRF